MPSARPFAQQALRDHADGEMREEVIARVEQQLPGGPLLVPFVRNGCVAREETIGQMSDRGRGELLALPSSIREPGRDGAACPVVYSGRCHAALQEVDARPAQ